MSFYEFLCVVVMILRDEPSVAVEDLSVEFKLSEESVLALMKCARVEEIVEKTEAEKIREAKQNKWIS